MAEPDGAKLDNLYKLAWVKGLKTTYYLRTMRATHVEKSTLADGKLNAVQNSNTSGEQMFAQSQIQIAKHVNKREIKMLNWDDPLVQFKLLIKRPKITK